MNDEKTGDNSNTETSNLDDQNKNDNSQPLPFHNPFKEDDNKQLTKEDLENEQKYKEALSERD